MNLIVWAHWWPRTTKLMAPWQPSVIQPLKCPHIAQSVSADRFIPGRKIQVRGNADMARGTGCRLERVLALRQLGCPSQEAMCAGSRTEPWPHQRCSACSSRLLRWWRLACRRRHTWGSPPWGIQIIYYTQGRQLASACERAWGGRCVHKFQMMVLLMSGCICQHPIPFGRLL